MTQKRSALFRKSLIAACSLGLLFGASVSKAAEPAKPFDPFDDPTTPFAPVFENVAKDGILTGNIGVARWPLKNLPQISNFKVISHHVIPNPGDTVARGRNGGLAIANSGRDMGLAATQTCAYVGNRQGRRTGTGSSPISLGGGVYGPSGRPELAPEVAILDISDPENPVSVGYIQTPVGGTTREIRTLPDMNTLIVMNFLESGPSTSEVNNLTFYDITDCARPVLTQVVGFGNAVPHEFFVWRDPKNPTRFLIYVSHSSQEPSLRVYESIRPPFTPVSNTPVATFTMAPYFPVGGTPVDPARFDDAYFAFTRKPATSYAPGLHSMATNRDGTRVYLSYSSLGYTVLDSSLLAAGAPCTANTVTADLTSNADTALCLRKINPNPGVLLSHQPPLPEIHHSFYPIPNRPYAIASGERNGTTTCPWSKGQIIDLHDESNPQILTQYMVPENLPENCFIGGPGDPRLQREFSTHQPLIFENMFFQAWYSAGLRAWNTENVYQPYETGVFVPRPEGAVIERFRNSSDVWIWPFPILHNGLIYTVDENSGLYILKYTGEGASELPKRGTWQSNINFH